MRALTQRLAAACETARPESRCICRCNGTCHGAQRQLATAPIGAENQLIKFIVQLPPEDPHYVVNKRYQLHLPEVA